MSGSRAIDQRPAFESGTLFRRRLEGLAMTTGEHDMGAGRGEGDADASPDPLAGPGHHRHPIGKVELDVPHGRTGVASAVASASNP